MALAAAADQYWQLLQGQDGTYTVVCKDEAMTFTLPETGGPGTAMRLAVGVVTMVAAGAALRRRAI